MCMMRLRQRGMDKETDVSSAIGVFSPKVAL